MAVVNRNEARADLVEVAQVGLHLPEPTSASSEYHDHDHDDHHDHEHGFEIVEVLRVVFVALAAAAVWFHLWEPFHRVSVIGLVATLIGGYPIFKEAFENVLERRMTMELSMTIALISALAIGEFFTALVITAFVLAAEILEGLTVGRGRRAIQDMLDFLLRRPVYSGTIRLSKSTRRRFSPERWLSFGPAGESQSMAASSMDTRSWSRPRLRESRCPAKNRLAATYMPAP